MASIGPRGNEHVWCRAWLCVLLGLSTSSIVFGGVAEEYQVKAAFFYHFARFTTWPSQKFASDEDPVRVCIVGENPFRGALQKILSGKTVQDRSLALIQDASESDLPQCHVVFIGKGAADRLQRITSAAEGKGILTIGEDTDFIRQGGIVRLFVEQSKVRFGINPKAAQQAELEISSKLLRLAKIEHP